MCIRDRRYDYRANPPTPAPLIILSATDPLPARTYLYYPFQGEAGVRVRVVVEAQGGGLDPVAALLGPAGETIAEGDDSDGTLNPVFEALLPADGTYTVRVNAYGESAGEARVIVERLP